MTQAQPRQPPRRVDASRRSGRGRDATFIFLHGFGDDAEGVINIAHQFQSAAKLPHLSWIFPNAPFDHQSMATAWYTPPAFSPIPVGRSSHDAPEQTLDEDDDPAEGEILDSVKYVESLITEEVNKGVEPGRVVLGGFSQGCAISLTAGLGGKFKGKLAGVVGLSGYLPDGNSIRREREGYEKRMKIFLAHGTRDMLVPMRIFREAKKKVGEVAGEDNLEAHEYEGMGHVTSGLELRDMCMFLERVVPE